ncbi:MAG: hypothetical protein Q9227_004643 [Pyrenula ochraceoflavens]
MDSGPDSIPKSSGWQLRNSPVLSTFPVENAGYWEENVSNNSPDDGDGAAGANKVDAPLKPQLRGAATSSVADFEAVPEKPDLPRSGKIRTAGSISKPADDGLGPDAVPVSAGSKLRSSPLLRPLDTESEFEATADDIPASSGSRLRNSPPLRPLNTSPELEPVPNDFPISSGSKLRNSPPFQPEDNRVPQSPTPPRSPTQSPIPSGKPTETLDQETAEPLPEPPKLTKNDSHHVPAADAARSSLQQNGIQFPHPSHKGFVAKLDPENLTVTLQVQLTITPRDGMGLDIRVIPNVKE